MRLTVQMDSNASLSRTMVKLQISRLLTTSLHRIFLTFPCILSALRGSKTRARLCRSRNNRRSSKANTCRCCLKLSFCVVVWNVLVFILFQRFIRVYPCIRISVSYPLTNVSATLRSTHYYCLPYVRSFLVCWMLFRTLLIYHCFKRCTRLMFLCRGSCPGETQGTSSAFHANVGSVLVFFIFDPYVLCLKDVGHLGPDFSTSPVHYSVQFAKQVSPSEPVSPTVRASNSVTISVLLREVRLVATESVTKSFAFGPPTVLEGASFYTDLGPAHFSGATDDVFVQQVSGPITRHYKLPCATLLAGTYISVEGNLVPSVTRTVTVPLVPS